MSSRTNPKVVVLMGGPSFEREVSLSSGRECAAALRGEGFEVIELDAGADVAQRLAFAKQTAARQIVTRRSTYRTRTTV